eukprot:CAMPEP_0194200192 /NCGR_PEP_ID=MMETSP0156-20130528/902_1 /TAXON_ID=33649 /ORGANISM="Thalassionema nitzschioides, Strain L26-B" /LENGTH=529 /DNA_ID=CAMNT_0038925159 /DNA_START=44 /DNA_END=1633 /DNA_ORIENTATION=+
MRVLFLFLLALAARSVLVEAHEMGPGMHRAMNAIKQACSLDVGLLCDLQSDGVSMGPRTLRLGAPRDPIMELMMNPLAPPPSLLDVTSILDDMMKQALTMESDQSPPMVIHLFRIESDEPFTMAPAPEEVLDSMVHTLMERVDEKPEVIADQIVAHGNSILKTEQDEDIVRMARRLTQVDPKAVGHSHKMPLPFGCSQNRCLMRAFDQGALSLTCSETLRAAEETREIVARKVAAVEYESRAFLHFTIIYLVLAFVTLFALRRHLRKSGRYLHSRLALGRQIFQAVYSNPEIKAKVEDAIGSDIGFVPPLPPHVLAQMGGERHGISFTKKVFKAMAFASILTLILVDPVVAMFVLCILMFARFLHLLFCPPQPPKQSCSCCCCSASTDDVQNGTLTKDQACCTCCNGTGVCAPGCSDCCEPDDPCDCCTDDCDCCDSKDICECCCCGASNLDAAMGKLTAEQACCTCCKGTGVCAAGCKACCGDDSSCDCCSGDCDCCDGNTCQYNNTSMPSVRLVNEAVYQGIPIKVV